MFFVSVIRADGEQGQLFGPYEYAEAEEVLVAALKKGNNDNGPVEWTAEAQATVDDLGYYSFDGGGIFICQAEAYSENSSSSSSPSSSL